MAGAGSRRARAQRPVRASGQPRRSRAREQHRRSSRPVLSSRPRLASAGARARSQLAPDLALAAISRRSSRPAPPEPRPRAARAAAGVARAPTRARRRTWGQRGCAGTGWGRRVHAAGRRAAGGWIQGRRHGASEPRGSCRRGTGGGLGVVTEE